MYVHLENAVSVYWSERDKGTIIAFVGGEKDAVTVQEKPEQILKDCRASLLISVSVRPSASPSLHTAV